MDRWLSRLEDHPTDKAKQKPACGLHPSPGGNRPGSSLPPSLPKVQTSVSWGEGYDSDDDEFVRWHSISTISPIALSAGSSS